VGAVGGVGKGMPCRGGVTVGVGNCSVATWGAAVGAARASGTARNVEGAEQKSNAMATTSVNDSHARQRAKISGLNDPKCLQWQVHACGSVPGHSANCPEEGGGRCGGGVGGWGGGAGGDAVGRGVYKMLGGCCKGVGNAEMKAQSSGTQEPEYGRHDTGRQAAGKVWQAALGSGSVCSVVCWG